ncbi:MAG TPA: MGMT family protein [Armatimonadota bacterium]|jgi:methylated-DNA-protein-cysteine methyltransferase-like protein
MPEHPKSWRLNECYSRVYDIVREIPEGMVMTYGQIAGMVAEFCNSEVPAIQVGRAMANSERYSPDLPWWRVIGSENGRGVLRKRSLTLLQRDLLAREGIITDDDDRYDLGKYQYFPEDAERVDEE